MSLSIGPNSPKLQSEHILLFAHNAWNEVWRNNQHISSRLARENLVLYVEPKVYPLSKLRRGQVPKAVWAQPRLTHAQDSLWLYRHPVWAPRMPAKLGLDKLMRQLRRTALLSALRQLKFKPNFLSWVYQPKDSELVGQMGERFIIYSVVDEYAAFGHQTPEAQQFIRERERQLLQIADLVLVTSPALLASKSSLNPSTVWVPNGVDFTLFEQAWRANEPLPEDIIRLPRPIVGYSGHISGRLNLPLLKQLAEMRPNWSVVLVGSVWETGAEAQLAALRQLPNVYFLGQKPAAHVPHYISGFDVALIPYLQNEESRNINPIKLYEYLAMGKPVVTVDIPALDGFRHLVRMGDSADNFSVQIQAALTKNSLILVDERRQVAAANTWDQRAEHISRLIQA
ncbi:MAG: glycosyltransferase, partial [Anaerolineales bacterium]|nr:glycosyltransferase [Anaerolineales bacterium]